MKRAYWVAIFGCLSGKPKLLKDAKFLLKLSDACLIRPVLGVVVSPGDSQEVLRAVVILDAVEVVDNPTLRERFVVGALPDDVVFPLILLCATFMCA